MGPVGRILRESRGWLVVPLGVRSPGHIRGGSTRSPRRVPGPSDRRGWGEARGSCVPPGVPLVGCQAGTALSAAAEDH